MMMSGKDFLKSHDLSWQRKVYSDWEDVTSSGRVFQVFVLGAKSKLRGSCPLAPSPMLRAWYDLMADQDARIRHTSALRAQPTAVAS